MPTSRPPDLLLRIALVHRENDLRELEPSIWRTLRCSSGINLDAFQDKILQPLMGWTRNYHTYYFYDSRRQNKIYYQSKSTASDAFLGMHPDYREQSGEPLDPTTFTLADLLSKRGDVCYYAYDLGEQWYHSMTCQAVYRYSDLDAVSSDNHDDDHEFGKVRVIDGAMRCPNEDGEDCDDDDEWCGGAQVYQNQILDLLNAKNQNQNDIQLARDYAKACFGLRNAMNVCGRFDAEDFSLAATQAAVQEGIRSFLSLRMGNKQVDSPLLVHHGPQGFLMIDNAILEPGERKTLVRIQDDRGEDTGDQFAEPFFVSVKEIVSVKFDEDKFALCHACGNPYDLKSCGRCHMAVYCSENCQSSDWARHKKVCKKELLPKYKTYLKEKNGEVAVPQEYINNGKQLLKKFDPNNMRFNVGDVVECRVGRNLFLQGKVLQVLHESEGITHAYQVQLDCQACRRAGFPFTLIWADWDHDYQIRLVRRRRS